MNKLIYTSDIPFDMSDWEKLPIRNVYAGKNCIMAICDDGSAIQKIKDESKAARMQFWTRIKQISISKCIEGLAIGLVEDGTCLIGKRAARFACEITKASFDDLNDAVKEWEDIVQVEASDALFVLDGNGKVYYLAFSEFCSRDYIEVLLWKGIKRIVTGVQNSIFGITEEGKVLCAGANCREKYKDLDNFSDIIDVFPTGSECEKLYLVHRDGTVSEYSDGKIEGILCEEASLPTKRLDGTFGYSVYALTKDGAISGVSYENLEAPFEGSSDITSFAVGDAGYPISFVIATERIR